MDSQPLFNSQLLPLHENVATVSPLPPFHKAPEQHPVSEKVDVVAKQSQEMTSLVSAAPKASVQNLKRKRSTKFWTYARTLLLLKARDEFHKVTVVQYNPQVGVLYRTFKIYLASVPKYSELALKDDAERRAHLYSLRKKHDDCFDGILCLEKSQQICDLLKKTDAQTAVFSWERLQLLAAAVKEAGSISKNVLGLIKNDQRFSAIRTLFGSALKAKASQMLKTHETCVDGGDCSLGRPKSCTRVDKHTATSSSNENQGGDKPVVALSETLPPLLSTLPLPPIPPPLLPPLATNWLQDHPPKEIVSPPPVSYSMPVMSSSQFSQLPPPYLKQESVPLQINSSSSSTNLEVLQMVQPAQQPEFILPVNSGLEGEADMHSSDALLLDGVRVPRPKIDLAESFFNPSALDLIDESYFLRERWIETFDQHRSCNEIEACHAFGSSEKICELARALIRELKKQRKYKE